MAKKKNKNEEKSQSSNKFVEFIRESYHEMKHEVAGTKYSELQNQSILVLVASFIFAVAIYVIDTANGQTLEFLYKTFGK